MKMKHLLALAVIAATAGAAKADVIPGPVLDQFGRGWSVTGLGFQATDNSTLTSFVYQNQGQADTIILTDAAGNVLDSINTPAGMPSLTVNVNWALSAGQQYWLLQTVASNELFAFFGQPLPSDMDIQITQTGTFDTSIAGAVSNSNGWGANQYWAAFNDITTSAGGGTVPEPTSLCLLGLGLVGVGGYALRRKHATI